MDLLPIQYLHLETFIMPLFLGMVLLTQLARSSDPGYFISRSKSHMRWLLVIFAVMTLGFVGIVGSVSPLLAAELSAGSILSLLHPVNALCFFVHLLYLRPWEMAANPLLLALPRGLAFLCYFTWLIHPTLHGKPNPRTMRLLNILLAFSAWLFLSTFFSPHIAESQMELLNGYFKSLIIFIMCIYFIDSERSVKEFKLTVVVSVLALMVVRLYQVHTEGAQLVRIQSAGLFGDSNDLASLIVTALPFAMVPGLRKSANIIQQLSSLFYAGLALLVVWYSQSRGSMLALAVEGMAVGYMWSRGRIRFGTIALIAVLGTAGLLVLKSVHREAEEMHASSESRITYWKTAVNMTLHHPILGVGFGQYPANYDTYTVGTKYEYGLRTAHSSWFLAFAESGFLGGSLFVAFFVMVLKTAWRNREKWPDQFYSVVGTGVAMSFLSHTYVIDFYLLAGLIMASDHLKDRSAGEL